MLYMVVPLTSVTQKVAEYFMR